MSLDPITAIKIWTTIKPIKRWKARRERKQLERLSDADLENLQQAPDLAQVNEDYQEIGMGNEIVALMVRHAMTALGATGLLSGDDLQMAAGALATLAGLAWSAYRKWKRAR